MGKIVGIDLGTTNSLVAVLEGSGPVVRSQPILGQVMYNGAAATRPGGPGHPDDNGHADPSGEDVVEGEFSEM